MTLKTTPVGRSLLENTTHYHSKLWKVERTDGVKFYFTNHDREIVFNSDPFGFGAQDIQTYKPAGSFDATATQRSAGIKDPNKDLRGIITSDDITEKDLRSGLFRDAKITEFTVDSRYPFFGAIITEVFWVKDLDYAQDVWNARLGGIAFFLTNNVGDVLTKRCPYRLGDTECKKDLTNMSRTGVDVTTVISRSKFTVTGGTSAGELNQETPGSFADGAATEATPAEEPAVTLTDGAGTFVTDNVQVGDTVRNTTDGSKGLVTTVTSETVLVHEKLSGGAENDWDVSDAYTITSDPDLSDGYFALGVLTWKSGDNVGVPAFVAQYDNTALEFTLRSPMPNDIQAGDSFDVQPGCDKLFDTCRAKFDNKDNFGGDPYIPGISDVARGPEIEN